jgi:hypothetical protein
LSTGLADERTRLLVADRGAGEVLDVPISDTGALGVPGSVLSGVRPVALDVGYFLTADHADNVAVADGSGALRLLVTSPSRLVERMRGAANVAAGAGLVVWSQRVGSRHYRLRIADPSGVSYLPASTSRHRLAPRVGRAADGTPVVTYRRCSERGCTPWVWSVANRGARRMQVPTARGCTASDLAMWDGVLTFLSVSGETGRCRRGERGLWVRAGARTHRISRRATRLGDLRGRRVSWFEGDEVFGRLRVSSLHGRPRTVVGWTGDGRELELGLLSGQFVYWLEPSFRSDSPSSTLRRASVSARGPSCRFLPPEEMFDDPGFDLGRRTIAIDGAHVVYVDYYGVFAIAPQPARWRPCR